MLTLSAMTTFAGHIVPIGPVSITIDAGRVCRIEFKPAKKTSRPFTAKIRAWFRGYTKGCAGKFPYSLNLNGTPFQKAVWKAMAKIPYGETRTYGWVAGKAGRPKAVRAVGNACSANPLPILIPCHRVVASNGLGGFSSGLALKKRLLAMEKREAKIKP